MWSTVVALWILQYRSKMEGVCPTLVMMVADVKLSYLRELSRIKLSLNRWVGHAIIIIVIRIILTFLQMTWIPNEIENFDLVVFEFLDRLSEPKGWLRKLWESVSPQALMVFAASDKWDEKRIGSHIGKWWASKLS